MVVMNLLRTLTLMLLAPLSVAMRPPATWLRKMENAMKMYTSMKFNNKILLGALLIIANHSGVYAATATGTMTVTATLTSACSVSASSMTFPAVAALSSSSDQTTDTGGTLQIACTAGATPTIWSDTTRTVTDGTNTFAFNLSQTAGAASDDLPTTTGAAEAIAGFTADGTEKTVIIYGKILAANFASKPAGTYTRDVILSINYE